MGGVGGSMTGVVGGTPVVRLNEIVPEGAADVLVKLEWFNPTGSYKDRMALAMVEEAEKRGDLRPGMTVVEYTGVAPQRASHRRVRLTVPESEGR
jgi:cysteine synthase A